MPPWVAPSVIDRCVGCWPRVIRDGYAELDLSSVNADVGVAGADMFRAPGHCCCHATATADSWTPRGLPVATQDTIAQLAECLLRQADRYRPREFGINESDGAPDEKEGRPKHEPPDYQACMMRGEMWPRRQETFPADASPPRCAQLMGLASRGCLVLVLGATAERRNLLFRSDLGLPWIRTLGLPRLSR